MNTHYELPRFVKRMLMAFEKDQPIERGMVFDTVHGQILKLNSNTTRRISVHTPDTDQHIHQYDFANTIPSERGRNGVCFKFLPGTITKDAKRGHYTYNLDPFYDKYYSILANEYGGKLEKEKLYLQYCHPFILAWNSSFLTRSYPKVLINIYTNDIIWKSDITSEQNVDLVRGNDSVIMQIKEKITPHDSRTFLYQETEFNIDDNGAATLRSAKIKSGHPAIKQGDPVPQATYRYVNIGHLIKNFKNYNGMQKPGM